MKKRPKPKPELLRLMFQARYKPELRYFSLADLAAAKFEDQYPIWTRQPHGSIRLSDYAHRCAIDMGYKSFSYTQDSRDLSLGLSRLERMTGELPEQLQVQHFMRLGLRQFVLLPVEMGFESLVAVMTAKLYQHGALKDALPDSIDDLFFRVDASDADVKFHIAVAPLRKEEISKKVVDLSGAGTVDPKELTSTLATLNEEYPETSVLFDVDIYVDGDPVQSPSPADFVPMANERIEGLIQGLTEYLFQAEVVVE